MIPLGFVSCKLQASSYKLQAPSLKLQASSLQVSSYKPQAPSHQHSILNEGKDLGDLLDVPKIQR